jgi:hypothetical protein
MNPFHVFAFSWTNSLEQALPLKGSHICFYSIFYNIADTDGETASTPVVLEKIS